MVYVKKHNWNPYIVNQGSYVDWSGLRAYRWDNLLIEVHVFLQAQFGFSGLLKFLDKNDNKMHLYAGINDCHKGHNGIHAAKLFHAIVCFRDSVEGAGQWKWLDEPQNFSSSKKSSQVITISENNVKN